MINIEIKSNIKQIASDFDRSVNALLSQHSNFLANQRSALQRHVNFIVDQYVYNIYRPRVYVRTGKFKRSMSVTIGNDGDSALIWSDASIAPALFAEGGYGKFIAGEGGGSGYGIGFLRTQYGEGTDDFRFSFFPRQFHLRMVQAPSPFYFPDLQGGLREEWLKMFDRTMKRWLV